jgi:hypothetical protein
LLLVRHWLAADINRKQTKNWWPLL